MRKFIHMQIVKFMRYAMKCVSLCIIGCFMAHVCIYECASEYMRTLIRTFSLFIYFCAMCYTVCMRVQCFYASSSLTKTCAMCVHVCYCANERSNGIGHQQQIEQNELLFFFRMCFWAWMCVRTCERKLIDRLLLCVYLNCYFYFWLLLFLWNESKSWFTRDRSRKSASRQTSVRV